MRYKKNNNKIYEPTSCFGDESQSLKEAAENERISMMSVPPDEKGIDSSDDNELIIEFLKGDKNAFTLLMRKHEKKIYAFVLSYVKNKYDAEDITQDTFMRAYKYIDTFSFRSSFTTWLHTIAKNLSLSFLEREKRRNSMIAVPVKPDDEDTEKDPLDNVSTGETAEDTVMKNELYSVVVSEIEKLPNEYREAIILREVNRLSYEQIADILEISVGTVKSRISRARTMLRNAVADFL